jgi:hypothetical protein
VISEQMMDKFNCRHRNGKQCRERWHNHLSEKVIKHEWSEKEEAILTEKHIEYGNRWSDIARFLPGRYLKNLII